MLNKLIHKINFKNERESKNKTLIQDEVKRNFLKQFFIISITGIIYPNKVFGKEPADELYYLQKGVFKKNGIHKMMSKYPQYQGQGVDIGYIGLNSPKIKYDIGKYKTEFLSRPNGPEASNFNHPNSMIGYLKSKRNAKGVAGIIPKSNLTFFTGKNLLSDISRIYNKGIKLIGSSIADSNKSNRDIRDINNYLINNPDLIFIIAGGNYGHNLKADNLANARKVEEAFTVGALDYNNKIHKFSSTGCDFYINTGNNDGVNDFVSHYTPKSGSYYSGNKTSQGTAVLTGIVGIIRQILPNSSRSEVEKILQKTAKIKYPDGGYLINAYKAVKLARKHRYSN